VSSTTKKRGVSKQGAFLAAFATTASVTKAAEAAGIDRCLHYRWLSEDPAYRERFTETRLQAGEALEDQAVLRAHEGVLKPVFFKGRPTGAVREYSDALLMKLLDGFLPEKYKRRSGVEVTGANGGPIALEAAKLTALTDEELAALTEIARKLKPE
jgi:hypothetical protein